MTPTQIRRFIAQNDALAAKLRKKADEVDAQTATLREMLNESTESVLHKRLQKATVNVEMNTDHRQAISRSRPGDEAFRKAIGRYTQNELARAVGISPATLSFYRNGRKVPRKVADDVERLTGFRATAKNWPGGIHGAE